MKICVEGNIGSGKSTVITRLCQDKRIPVFLEPVDEWKEWLSLFYTDPSRWGLAFNLQVLMTFNQWKNNDFTAVYERSPISNRHVFTQIGYEQGRLNSLELGLFDSMYNKLAWKPDVIIYIKTDPEVSMQRMQERARDCECAVPLEYLQSIHFKHEELFRIKQTRNVFVVDGNRGQDDVYNDVLQIIESVTSSSQAATHNNST